MYTVRIFETIDCSFDNIIESNILADEFALFKSLFMRKDMVYHDIQVYENDTLFYVGHVGDCIYYLLNCFKEELDKEYD